MIKSKQFWNIVAKNYDKQVNKKYKQAYSDTILHTRKYLQKTNVVLDVGCGTGITSYELSNHIKRMVAIDTSNKMIQIAQNKGQNHLNNIHFKVIDIFNPELDQMKFDAILIFNTLHFIHNINKFLHRASGLLLPGGLLISVTDCLGEKYSLKMKLNVILSHIGLIPFMKPYSINELINTLIKNNFQIIETKNFFENPPNYFIVAKRK